MYQFKSRVRFSETATDRKLSIAGVLNYLQDCSIFHSEDIGVGFEYLEKVKKAWLLSAWNVEIIRRPDVTEEITVGTWPYAFKGIYGLRNFAIFDKEGNYLVKADSCWFLVNTETGRPARQSPEDIEAYVIDTPRIDMEELPRKIAMPEGMQAAGELVVRKEHLDTNMHVNNAQYVAMACELVPDVCEIVGIRAEYKKSAVLGDKILFSSTERDGTYWISLCAGDGSVFANVELRTVPGIR